MREEALDDAQNAQLLYLPAKPGEKRRLLKLVLSNLRLNGVTVEYQIRNPFHNFVKWASREALLAEVDEYRTFLNPAHDPSSADQAEKA